MRKPTLEKHGTFGDYTFIFSEWGMYLTYLLAFAGIGGIGYALSRLWFDNYLGRVSIPFRILIGLICAGLFVGLAAGHHDPPDHRSAAEKEVDEALGEYRREQLYESLP